MSEVHQIHEHGHLVLEDVMGSELSIVNNARVSFDQESTEFGPKEEGLLNFLMRERHGSPWEAVVFRFDVKAPLFVIREWQRHRIGSFNEQSARYSVIPDQYYVPARDAIREQVGKPGAYTFSRVEDDTVAREAQAIIDSVQENAFAAYNDLIDRGFAKEIARIVLPVGMYSRMKWTVNLRSLLNFLSLRNSPHAQGEIRDYATVIEKLVESRFPTVIRVFNENGRVVP